MSVTPDLSSRRPLTSRDTAWARSIARSLSRTPLQPNVISCMSVVFAAGAGACLWEQARVGTPARILLLLGAVACMQLRLLCNLFDGMVAVEGGKASRTGDIFNEVPDRFADMLILVPIGYACIGEPFALELGWLAGSLAVLTAYLRVLGGALKLKQDFSGPMAKQQRMATVTGACVFSCFEPLLGWHGVVLYAALVVVVLGCFVTVARRLARLAHALEARA